MSAVSTTTSGVINPKNGVSTGMKSKFALKTNGKDCDYDFLLKANIISDAGESLNAFGKSSGIEYLILGNIDPSKEPTKVDWAKLKANNSSNPNLIAYPISGSVNNFQSLTQEDIGLITVYRLLLGSGQDGGVDFNIATNPIASTYDYAEDRSGTYQAIITFSAVHKP